MGKLSRQKRAIHRPNIGRPSYEQKPSRCIVEVSTPQVVMQGFQAYALLHGEGPSSVYCKSYRLGECTVMVTRERDDWHLSIAHPRRYPTWDEVAEARYELIPGDVTMAMLLPPKSDYINIHPNCFQVVEVSDRRDGRRIPDGSDNDSHIPGGT